MKLRSSGTLFSSVRFSSWKLKEQTRKFFSRWNICRATYQYLSLCVSIVWYIVESIRGPHEHSFLSSGLWTKHCIWRTLFSFLLLELQWPWVAQLVPLLIDLDQFSILHTIWLLSFKQEIVPIFFKFSDSYSHPIL